MKRTGEAKEIMERLEREGVSALYHFTNIMNLSSIREMGAICSKETLSKAGRVPPVHGGNKLSRSLDSRYNPNLVSLSFTPYTPMAYLRGLDYWICFFVFKIDVAGIEGVAFTDTNAVSSGHRREYGLEGLDVVDFKLIRSLPQPDNDEWKHSVQAEVLVPNQLTFDFLIEVGFKNEADLVKGENEWGNFDRPSFVVKPNYFSTTHAATIKDR